MIVEYTGQKREKPDRKMKWFVFLVIALLVIAGIL